MFLHTDRRDSNDPDLLFRFQSALILWGELGRIMGCNVSSGYSFKTNTPSYFHGRPCNLMGATQGGDGG